jgi:hypothetical protein
MKSHITILFFLFSTILSAQVIQTYSKTYRDTLVLGSLSLNSIERGGFYYAASGGFGLNMAQGSFCQLIKVDQQGYMVDRLFSFDTTRRYNAGVAIAQSPTGDFIISYAASVKNAYSPRGFVIEKVTPDFDTIWEYRGDTSQYDSPLQIFAAAGKIYIVGVRNFIDTADPYMFDGLLLILNDDGSFIDLKIYHEELGDVYLNSIVPCADGGFFLGGQTNKTGQNEGYLIKIDSSGIVLWSRNYPTYYSAYFTAYDNERIILSGALVTQSLFKGKLGIIDTSGSVVWDRTYQYETDFEHYRAMPLNNGNIVSVGLTFTEDENNGGYIGCYSPTGEVIWQRRYNYNEDTDFFTNVIETSDGGLLINGSADDGFEGGGSNLWLVKLDSMGCLEPNCWVGLEGVEPNNLGISLFPNPANDWLNFKLQNTTIAVTLELFSIAGQRVMNAKLTAPLEAIQVSHLPAGLYLAEFTLEDGRSVMERVIISR